jgi:Sulfotransferase family
MPLASVPPASGVAFIVGPPRSGTSLLYKLLCLHPDAAWISNWLARFPRLPQLAALNRVARVSPDRRRRVWFSGGENAYVYGRTRALADRVFPMPVEGEPVYRAAGVPRSSVAGVGGPVEGLARAFHDVRRLGGGSVVISKRIANNQRIDVLDETFPGARFVSMVRDGRAVACSLSRVDWWPDTMVPWYGGTPRDWEAEGRDPWELCARTWVEELLEVRGALGAANHVHEVRYETLVDDPVPVLEEVGRFVGLDPDPRWTAALRRLSYPNRNETWRSVLEPAVVERITEIQRPLLEELGYLDAGAAG